MVRTIALTIFLSSVFAYGQGTLSILVDSLMRLDQKWRGLIEQIDNHKIDTITRDFANKQIQLTDSLNFIQIEKLFDSYGYLGYDKVGLESSHNFWLLVQHSDRHPKFQDSVLKKMKIEALKGNSSVIDYGYLYDRVRVNQGQLQYYGTQMTLNSAKTSYEPKPVIDPSRLNERRKSIGLDTIEEYIEVMNKRYFGSLDKK